MRNILLLFFTFSLACSHDFSSHQSKWSLLKKVTAVRCEPWEVEKRAHVSQVKRLRSSSWNYLASERRNLKGEGVHELFQVTSHSPYLSNRALMTLPLPQEERFFGYVWNRSVLSMAVLKKSTRSDVQQLILLELPEKKEFFSQNMKELESSKLVSAGGEVWISSSKAQKHSFRGLVPSKVRKPSSSVVSISEPQFLELEDGRTLMVTSKEQGGRLLWSARYFGGNQKTPFIFQLPRIESAESFKFHIAGSTIYVAIVGGDSLAGDAIQYLAAYRLRQDSLDRLWLDENKVDDIHMSNPFWVQRGLQTYLAFMIWVDAEGTLMLRKVDKEGLSPISYHGIFGTGSSVVADLSSEADLVLMVRKSKKSKLSYEVCVLEDLGS